MKTSRRQDDGGVEPEKMSPFTRINAEFGAWQTITPTSTTIPSSDMMILDDHENLRAASPNPPAPTPSPANVNATMRPSCRIVNPLTSYRRGTPRYSKIDIFIEGLDAACEALPTPLVGSASAGPPPATRATSAKELVCSSTTQQDRHLRKSQQHQEDRRPLFSTKGNFKEVKFADEVVEIGEPEGMVAERTSESMSTVSEKNVFEVRSREPPGAKETTTMGTDGVGAPPPPPPPPRLSRAMRFDYRKKRSDFVKAATVVQSTYRGYKVRRGQPLKDLLVISSVKEKLEELRQQFDAWKIAAWFPTDFTERAAMTESVMELLLQLDSLQGVPVVVREFRKNVARDVINFQEELDGFLCRNIKHGVLFDLTRPGGKAAQGSSTLKTSKTIRNIVVKEPNLIENLRDSDSKACSTGHNRSWREEVKGETITSIDLKNELESDCQRKIDDFPLYSVQPQGSSGKNFVLWSPGDAKFENTRVEETSRNENQLESVTELRKCVASTGNVEIPVPTDRKKKSLRVRFGIVSYGDRSFRKERVCTDDECPIPPPEDASPCNSTYVESLMTDMHHPPDVLSWQPTGNCQKKHDFQRTVSINKQRSLDPYKSGRIQFPNNARILDVHEHLGEDCEIRYPQTTVRPQTPAQSDFSLTEKWEAEFPAELHRDNPIETHTSNTGMEHGEDRESRHPQTLGQPDYSLMEKWEAEFPADLRCDNRMEMNKSCAGMENNPALIFEPTPAQEKELHTPVKDVTSRDLYDEHFGPNQTKLHAIPCRVDLVSAKDVREGTIEPLLAGDREYSEMDYPVAASQLECSSKDTFQSFGGYHYIDSSPRGGEGDRMCMSQDMPNGLGAKDGDPCSVAVFPIEEEKLEKLRISRSGAVEVGQSILPKKSENSPMLIPKLRISRSGAVEVGQSILPKKSENSPILIPATRILNCNIGEQFHGESGKECDLGGCDDLETISSCSNCAAYPADCVGEPWDFESGIHEQVQHQPYALKGLVRELDAVLSERKGEEKQYFEDGHWKDEAWRDYTTTEFQPYHSGTITTRSNFEREVEVEREDGSCKSFKTFESDKVNNFSDTEPNTVVETELVSPHADVKESTCPESKGSNPPCTSQFLGEEGVGSMAIVLHENESNMLSKLVEDNKRLKELLTEVVKWSTAQANAMIILNERLELVESKK